MKKGGSQTPYWYGGDRPSVLALFPFDGGVRVSLTVFGTDEQLDLVLPWGDFADMASDANQIASKRGEFEGEKEG